MTYPTAYQPAVRCVGSERPGARALQNYLLAAIGALPGCTTVDSGIYNCRKIRGSSTRYSVHAEGRAGDVGVREPDGAWPTSEIDEPGIREWADRLIANADKLGITYVIYARQSRRPEEDWKQYAGASAHLDHIHWEMRREAAEQLTPADVVAAFNDTGDSNMLEQFIAAAYVGKRGYNPFRTGRDEAGAFYWLRAAAEENPDSAWTWQDCLDSFQLGVMVALLEDEQ